MAQARTIVVGDGPEPWSRLGFAVQEDGSAAVGRLRIATGGAGLAIEAEGLAVERPDGLPITSTAAAPPAAAVHPNGALAVDHVVAFTDDLDRTGAALEAAGAPLRRRAEPRGLPMAFHRLGDLILEVVQADRPPGLWGLVVTVADLDACTLIGEPRDAVQPGRRIATVRPEAGLTAALAFITPQPGRTALVES